MRFVVKYRLTETRLIEADSLDAAHKLAIVGTDKSRVLLGLVPEGLAWPGDEVETPMPPRGRPPSGTPGTPTVTILEDQPLMAVAA